jgi:hypothetical protein
MLRRLGMVLLVGFALFGFCKAVVELDEFHSLPPAFANPFSFLILEIRPPGSEKVCGRIYLAGAKDPKEIHFEGESLTHQESKISHFQSSVPFNGFVVSGSGRVIFGKAVIEIHGDTFTLNGQEAQPIDFTVGRNGAYRVGIIRIAH